MESALAPAAAQSEVLAALHPNLFQLTLPYQDCLQ